MNIIFAQESLHLLDDNNHSIFLAGPTPRSKSVQSWRPNIVNMLKTSGFDGTILIPEMKNYTFTKDFEYSDQIDWELEAMEKARTIIFWIPRDIENMPGFTTNIELGYWLDKNPDKLIIGIPPNAKKCEYIRYICEKINIPIYNTLPEVIKKLTNI